MEKYNVGANLFSNPLSKKAIQVTHDGYVAQEEGYKHDHERFYPEQYDGDTETLFYSEPLEHINHRLTVLFEDICTMKTTQTYNDVSIIGTLKAIKAIKILMMLNLLFTSILIVKQFGS